MVVTHMNRCSIITIINIVHCTRCIRFAEEVAGFHELGTSGRGRST
jgi:NADH dehydrogenase/NADH:ubiquinone oxidoreductase subunit G